MGNSLWQRWRQRFSNSSSAREGRCPPKRLFTRLLLEPLEDRSLPSASIPPLMAGEPILNYRPVIFLPWYDRGPTSYVGIVDQSIAIYGLNATVPSPFGVDFGANASGRATATSTLADFWFKAGHLGSTDGGSGLNSPTTYYFDSMNRFMVSEVDVNPTTHAVVEYMAWSKSGSPATLTAADWTFYGPPAGAPVNPTPPTPPPAALLPVNVKFVNQGIGIYGRDAARPTAMSSLADFWFKAGHLGSTDGGSG
jgi:hypothetical protein